MLDTDPALPDAAALDRIAQAIKEDAKGEVRHRSQAEAASTTKSIAQALAARGLTQEQIAKQLGVKYHRTIGNWLGNSALGAELPDAPALPDAARLGYLSKLDRYGGADDARGADDAGGGEDRRPWREAATRRGGRARVIPRLA